MSVCGIKMSQAKSEAGLKLCRACSTCEFSLWS